MGFPIYERRVAGQATRMKSWPEWYELWYALQHEQTAVAPLFTKSPVWSIVVEKIDAAEHAQRRKVDAVCERWIATHEWPKMTARTKWFVWLRCVNAAATALLILQPSGSGPAAVPAFAPAPGMTEETMTRWFLIDCWPYGWSGLRDRLRSGGAVLPPVSAPGRN